MDNGPVGGTPLLPPSYLTAYFLVFLLVLLGVYFFVSRRKKPVVLWHKVRLFVILAVFLKIFFLAGISVIAAYWLIPPPGVRRTLPEADSASFSPTNRIEVVFDRPVARYELEKSITPETPGKWVFEDSIYTTHLYRRLVFYPTYSFVPDTEYKIQLRNIQNLVKVSTPYNYEFKFRTQSTPEIASVSPHDMETDVDINKKIEVKLDLPNMLISEFQFLFEPQVDFDVYLSSDNKTYTLSPKVPLDSGAEYLLRIKKTDTRLNLEDSRVVERGMTQEAYVAKFTTKGDTAVAIKTLKRNEPMRVVEVNPEDGWEGVSVKSEVKITFDQSVSRVSAESKFKIEPEIEGEFEWEGNTLRFIPGESLDFSTNYKVMLASGVVSREGLPLDEDLKISFTTVGTTVKLSVPAYLQRYSLSCEVATLRMALAYRGISVSEDTLLAEVGFDSTSHKGNIWGNPYNAFVGNVRGRQMVDGYGVYWGPIARVARSYRGAEEFQGWDISRLTKEVEAGNPVVIWGYSKNGSPTSWTTPDGQNIYAVRGEHTVAVVGFVGTPDNPTQIIVNDPLVGQVYWSRALFDKKWAVFNRSGVVIY